MLTSANVIESTGNGYKIKSGVSAGNIYIHSFGQLNTFRWVDDDNAPSNQYVGTIGGIQNTFANIAGIVAPIITGYIVYNTGNFAIVLIISGGLSILGTLSYWFVVGELASISLIRKKEEII